METEQNKLETKEKKQISSVPVIIGIVVLVLAVAAAILVYDNTSNGKLMDKINYVDEEKDIAVITLPESMFQDNVEEMESSMRESDGVYDTRINSDGSLTVMMNTERYNKIKEAAVNAANSVSVIMITEDSAIRNYVSNDDFTVLDITVNKNSETLAKEVNDCVYYARLYHVVNMNSDTEIKVNYTSEGEDYVYLTEIYDINGKKITSVSSEIADVTESATE